jgi:ATP synthase protein I
VNTLKNKEPEKPLLKQIIEASSVGIHLVISTFVGLAIGYGLDRLFGTSPYLTFIFLIIGIISGFRELVRIAKKQEKDRRE